MKSTLKRFYPILLAGIAGFVFPFCEANTTECGSGNDCTIMPTCSDKLKNGTESDVDYLSEFHRRDTDLLMIRGKSAGHSYVGNLWSSGVAH